MKPNNVTRLLDAHRIAYTAFELPVEKLGALEAATHLNVDPELVYKTIVITRLGKGKPILAVVPGSHEVDLKAVARIVGEKKVHLPTEREAEALTGLKAGGISPLALIQRDFQVILDASVLTHDEIYISGGQRGLNIRLAPQALAGLTGAKITPIST